MRIRLWAAVLLLVLLAGCATPSQELSQTIPEETPQERQAVVLSGEPLGVYDEDSLLGYPIFISLEDSKPYYGCSNEIYRTIYPWNGGDVFKELMRRVKSAEVSFVDISDDIIASFLLTEDSVTLSDEMLLERLSNVTTAYVFSHYSDSLNYRVVAFNRNTTRLDGYYWYEMTWQYYVQVWNDEYIWAQPLCENTEFIFDKAIFSTSHEGNKLVLLLGETSSPSGRGLARAGIGFERKDEIWVPIDWDTTYEQIAKPSNLEICSDGIKLVALPEWLGIPFEGPLYTLELAEDGSFWANYSHHMDWPENEGLPPRELLFRLKRKTS